MRMMYGLFEYTVYAGKNDVFEYNLHPLLDKYPGYKIVNLVAVKIERLRESPAGAKKRG